MQQSCSRRRARRRLWRIGNGSSAPAASRQRSRREGEAEGEANAGADVAAAELAGVLDVIGVRAHLSASHAGGTPVAGRPRLGRVMDVAGAIVWRKKVTVVT